MRKSLFLMIVGCTSLSSCYTVLRSSANETSKPYTIESEPSYYDDETTPWFKRSALNETPGIEYEHNYGRRRNLSDAGSSSAAFQWTVSYPVFSMEPVPSVEASKNTVSDSTDDQPSGVSETKTVITNKQREHGSRRVAKKQ